MSSVPMTNTADSEGPQITDWKPWASASFTGARVKIKGGMVDETLDIPGVIVVDLMPNGLGEMAILLVADSDISDTLDRDACCAAILNHAKAKEPMTQEADWIPHDGGPCPVPHETDVIIKTNELSAWGPHFAKHLAWDHMDEPGDIIAYRLVP